jgi:hypothetical protein
VLEVFARELAFDAGEIGAETTDTWLTAGCIKTNAGSLLIPLSLKRGTFYG